MPNKCHCIVCQNKFSSHLVYWHLYYSKGYNYLLQTIKIISHVLLILFIPSLNRSVSSTQAHNLVSIHNTSKVLGTIIISRGIHSPLALGLWQIMKMDSENRLFQKISLLDARTWAPQQEHRILDGFWLNGLSPCDACIMFTLTPNLPHQYLYNLPYSEIQNCQKMLDRTHSHLQSTQVNNFYGVEHIKCIYMR